MKCMFLLSVLASIVLSTEGACRIRARANTRGTTGIETAECPPDYPILFKASTKFSFCKESADGEKIDRRITGDECSSDGVLIADPGMAMTLEGFVCTTVCEATCLKQLPTMRRGGPASLPPFCEEEEE